MRIPAFLLPIPVLVGLASARDQPDNAAVHTIQLSAIRGRGLSRRLVTRADLPLTNYFLQTDLQWYATIQIGTPPQNLSVVFDTGSPDIIFQSNQCTPARGCNNPNKFNTDKSTTWSTDGKSWPKPLVFGTGIGTGVGSAASPQCNGIYGRDTVSIAGLSVSNQAIAPITTMSPDLFGKDYSINGIFGMATRGGSYSGYSFMSGLLSQKKISKRMFSLYLTPKKIGNAEMTLGGINNARYKGDITYIPTDGRGSDWMIKFDGIAVNGQKTEIAARKAIADSGTSNMVAPRADVEKIYAMISPKIQLIDRSGAYGLPCADVGGINAVIGITMGNATFTIPSQELSVGPYAIKPNTGPYQGKDGICQTLLSTGTLGNMWVIGASLLKYYYTIWDMDKMRLGLAKTAHSPA